VEDLPIRGRSPAVGSAGPGNGRGGVFLGEHQHTLDVKGRVILPARFRDRLSSGLVFVPSQDRAIDVFPLTAFERRVEQLRQLPREDQGARGYLRVLLAGAHEDKPDSQGRVTIPPRLREYAKLDRDITVNGADEKVEIWDRAAWEAYRTQAEDAFANLDGPFGVGTW
jgi:MraZ protein